MNRLFVSVGLLALLLFPACTRPEPENKYTYHLRSNADLEVFDRQTGTLYVYSSSQKKWATLPLLGEVKLEGDAVAPP